MKGVKKNNLVEEYLKETHFFSFANFFSVFSWKEEKVKKNG